MGWCDTLAMHATDGNPISQAGVEVQGMQHETGALTGHEVPARVRWAQKVVKARAEMDEKAFTALVNELAGINDGNVRGSFVGAVLEVAALSIRTLPRGYARMGRS